MKKKKVLKNKTLKGSKMVPIYWDTLMNVFKPNFFNVNAYFLQREDPQK